MCPCQAWFTIFRVLNTYVLAQNTLKITVGDSIPSAMPTQHRAPRQQSARARERRQACDMDGNSTSVFSALDGKLPLPPSSWWLERPDPGATSHHRHDLRSCIVRENNSWLWWMRRYKKRSARATSAPTVGNGSDAPATAVDASATAVPVLRWWHIEVPSPQALVPLRLSKRGGARLSL